jgi:hypothetical protein
LPNSGKVDAALSKNPEDPNETSVNASVVVLYTISEFQNFALERYLRWNALPRLDDHISKYKLLTLNAPNILAQIASTVGAESAIIFE